MHIPQANIHKTLGQSHISISLRIAELQMVSCGIRTQALSGPSLIRKAYAISDGFLAYILLVYLELGRGDQRIWSRTLPRPL